jgi:hypothetical protein
MSCVRKSQTPFPQSLEIPLADPPSPASEEAHSSAPSPSPNPGDDNGSKACSSDDQQQPAEDPLQSPAEVGNARAGAGEPPAGGTDIDLADGQQAGYPARHRKAESA